VLPSDKRSSGRRSSVMIYLRWEVRIATVAMGAQIGAIAVMACPDRPMAASDTAAAMHR